LVVKLAILAFYLSSNNVNPLPVGDLGTCKSRWNQFLEPTSSRQWG